ncbi:MAG: hypothetical protein LBL92_02750, partial [Propionibacteriaceae bacterium]|nr:hypothetical protein [Propionibacteriaceae bacterium]
MRRTRILVTSLLLAVTVVLSGCVQSPRTAAVVNDYIITEAEVTAATEVYQRVVEELNLAEGAAIGPADIRLTVLGWLIDGVIAAEVSQVTDEIVSDAEVEELASQYSDAPLLLADSGSRGAMAGELRWALLWNRTSQGVISQEAVVSVVTGLEVELNPRYGTWSSDQLRPTNAGLGVAASLS